MTPLFKDIPVIPYEGPASQNPLAFKYYHADEKIGGKTMKEHLRFSMAYWHTLKGEGSDPFGMGTMQRPWDGLDDMSKSLMRVDAAFEIMQKLGITFYCFHDHDIAPEGKTLSESNKNLDKVVDLLKVRMKETGCKLLWGTANLFSNPRFVHGAGTAPNAEVFAYAGAKVKKAIEITTALGGGAYLFWGGREGYETLLNTNMGLELDNLARLMHMAVDYARSIGFKGVFFIEPKPKEPTKHQYDFDCATAMTFLKTYGLDKDFYFNIETNHATLAGHTMQHELCFARTIGKLGSVDANQGDMLLGWDTDQFPTDLYTTTLAMYEVLKNGGLPFGGLNFDAKPRRASFEPQDIFLSHIAGMDAFAKGLKVAHRLLEDKALENIVEKRYASYKTGIGKDIVDKKVTLVDLEKYAMTHEPANVSGRQESLEALLNRYILETK